MKNQKETSFSVALLVFPARMRQRLLLVQQQNLQWGLPAGHADIHRDFASEMAREFHEETNLLGELAIWSVRTLLLAGRTTRLAVSAIAAYHGNLPGHEWPVRDPGEDVVRARLFRVEDLLNLLSNPDSIYRSEYNVPGILDWLINLDPLLMRLHKSGRQQILLQGWLEKNAANIPGLTFLHDDIVGRYESWQYVNPAWSEARSHRIRIGDYVLK